MARVECEIKKEVGRLFLWGTTLEKKRKVDTHFSSSQFYAIDIVDQPPSWKHAR